VEETKKRRLISFTFFIFLGLIFAALIYWIASGNTDPNYERILSNKKPIDRFERTLPDTDKIVLNINGKKHLENMILIYKGRERSNVKFDVIIPDLDREYPYPYTIDLKKAKKSFTLSDQIFILTFANNKIVHLKHLSK